MFVNGVEDLTRPLIGMLTLFGFKLIGMSGGGTLAVLMMGTTIHNSLSMCSANRR